MDYQMLVHHIRKYLKQLYNYRISFGLRDGLPLSAQRSDLLQKAIPAVSGDVLELLLQQMYEDNLVVKDDGQTVEFSTSFVFD